LRRGRYVPAATRAAIRQKRRSIRRTRLRIGTMTSDRVTDHGCRHSACHRIWMIAENLTIGGRGAGWDMTT
jgi:hypothetical protein